MYVCERQCSDTRGPQFCSTYCTCVADGLKAEKLFTPFNEGKVDIGTNDRAQSVIKQCVAAQEN